MATLRPSYSSSTRSHAHAHAHAHPHSPSLLSEPTFPGPDFPSSAPTRSSTATETAFYRRVLFANLSPGDPTPPLTRHSHLDHQLYLLFAYLLRETVLPWYSKLTPDRGLLTEIIHIINHLLSSLPERLSSPDSPEGLDRLHTLLGKQLPLVLRQHYRDVRSARSRLGSPWAPFTSAPAASRDAFTPAPALPSTVFAEEPEPPLNPQSVAQLHRSLSPHPGVVENDALSGKMDLLYLRIALSSALTSLLPEENTQADTEKLIVRDVAVSVTRASLARCTRPWFFVQSIHKVLDIQGWPNARLDLQFSPADQACPPCTDADPSPLEHASAMLHRLWTVLSLLCTMVLPHVVRFYLDIFNPNTAPSTSRSKSQIGAHGRRESSTVEKSMHGRFPSGRMGGSGFLRRSASQATQLDETQGKKTGPIKTQAATPVASSEYCLPWLQLIDEVMETESRSLTNSLFGLAKLGVGLAGFGQMVDR